MRAPLRVAVVLLAALLADVPAAQFRSAAASVAVHVTVTGEDGRLVTDLTRADFEVLDNGTPVAITSFSNHRQPITVALMLDTSASMIPRLPRMRSATTHFIDALGPDDRATIGSFGYEVAVSPLLTGDKAVLRRVLGEELWPGGGTPLWNAIDAAMSALAAEPGRRVVLLLTDGADTGPVPGRRAGLREVSRRARDEGFMIYVIAMAESGLHARLRAISADSGGGQFELDRDDDLSAAFGRVAEELGNQYLLGFTPAALDGREHRLEVRLTARRAQVRARRSYVAAPSPR